MKKLTYILLASVLLFACNSKHEHDHKEHKHEESSHDEHGHDEHDDHHEEGTVSLSKAQTEATNLKLGSFKEIKISEIIETNGELELAPQNIADIHVLVGGVITNIKVIEGSKVKKGQLLATLKHPEIIKLQEDLISQTAELNYLEKEYTRQEKLYSEQVGSGKEFQKIKAEFDGGKALVDALKAKIRMLGISPENVINGKITEALHIVSPISGQISLVETNIGQFVSTDKRLFQVVDNRHLHCAFRIYENDILKVKEGQEIIVSSPSFGTTTFKAIIYAISPAFEENPKNVHIHADFTEHDERLISGMYVSGKINTDSITRTVLPRAAVVIEDNKKFVFVRQEAEETSVHEHDEHEHDHNTDNDHHDQLNFKKVEVQTGIEQDDWIEIINRKDFEATAEIALSSAYYLQAELGKAETAHVH